MNKADLPKPSEMAKQRLLDNLEAFKSSRQNMGLDNASESDCINISFFLTMLEVAEMEGIIDEAQANSMTMTCAVFVRIKNGLSD